MLVNHTQGSRLYAAVQTKPTPLTAKFGFCSPGVFASLEGCNPNRAIAAAAAAAAAAAQPSPTPAPPTPANAQLGTDRACRGRLDAFPQPIHPSKTNLAESFISCPHMITISLKRTTSLPSLSICSAPRFSIFAERVSGGPSARLSCSVETSCVVVLPCALHG